MRDVTKGPFINDVTLLGGGAGGGEGVILFVTRCDRRRVAGRQKCDITLKCRNNQKLAPILEQKVLKKYV